MNETLKVILLLAGYAAVIAVIWQAHVQHCKANGKPIGFGTPEAWQDEPELVYPVKRKPRPKSRHHELTAQQREVIRSAMESGYTPSATTHRSTRSKAA